MDQFKASTKSIVNPHVIQNKQQREVKIQMLLRKPFALSDDRILKTNDKISKMGVADSLPPKKVANLPASSLFASNPAVKPAGVEQ